MDTDNNKDNSQRSEQQPELLQLKKEIVLLRNQLVFDHKVKGMIAGASMGYALFMKGDTMEKLLGIIGGGILGMRIGSSQQPISDEQKASIITGIQQRVDRLKHLQALEKGEVINRGPNKIKVPDMEGVSYDFYTFIPKWRDFLGDVSKNFHAIIHGKPKQGKSILAVQLADYLTNHGDVMYIASEEGLRPTFIKKMEDFATSTNTNMEVSNWRNMEEIRNGLKEQKYDFVVIDSINFAKLTPEDVEELKMLFPKTAFITIMQSTKSGHHRGSQEYGHNCDIIITVERGVATQIGRFNQESELMIFEAPELKNEQKENPQTNTFTGESDEVDYTEMKY